MILDFMRYYINKQLLRRISKLLYSFDLSDNKKLHDIELRDVDNEVVDRMYDVLCKEEPDYEKMFERIESKIRSDKLNPVDSTVWMRSGYTRVAGVAIAAVVLLLLVFNFHRHVTEWFGGYDKDVSPEMMAKLNMVHDRNCAKLIIDDSFEVDLYGDSVSFTIDGLGMIAGKSVIEKNDNGKDAPVFDDSENRNDSDKKERVQTHTLVVPKGGEFSITLSDGTHVHLNSNAKLTFPSRFDGSKREVLLEGEALFSVTRSGVPFNVVSRNSVTSVLGTVFNVKSCSDVDQVTLCSGSVSVSNSEGKDSRVISPSHKATVGTAGISVEKADINEIVAWTEGKFYFKNIPLEEIASKLNDWYDLDFDFESAMLREVPFTGMINRNSSLMTIFELFELSYDIKFRVTGKKVVIRPAYVQK